jgi:hypothetical protein
LNPPALQPTSTPAQPEILHLALHSFCCLLLLFTRIAGTLKVQRSPPPPSELDQAVQPSEPATRTLVPTASAAAVEHLVALCPDKPDLGEESSLLLRTVVRSRLSRSGHSPPLPRVKEQEQEQEQELEQALEQE